MPSNRFRGIIGIELDKIRHLHFGLNALIALEETCGFPLEKIEGARKSPRLLRDLLWSGLVGEDPALTREDVGELVGVSELANLWDAVTRALETALGEAQLARLRAAAGAAGEKAPVKPGAIEVRGHGKKRSN